MVYPRVCGGTWVATEGAVYPHGLSPRVRGNLKKSLKETNFLGSIPACAGEPANSPIEDYQRRVYPRVCGGTRK